MLIVFAGYVFGSSALANSAADQFSNKYWDPIVNTQEIGIQYYREYGVTPGSLEEIKDYAQSLKVVLQYSIYEKVSFSKSGEEIQIRYFLTPESSFFIDSIFFLIVEVCNGIKTIFSWSNPRSRFFI